MADDSNAEVNQFPYNGMINRAMAIHKTQAKALILRARRRVMCSPFYNTIAHFVALVIKPVVRLDKQGLTAYDVRRKVWYDITKEELFCICDSVLDLKLGDGCDDQSKAVEIRRDCTQDPRVVDSLYAFLRDDEFDRQPLDA